MRNRRLKFPDAAAPEWLRSESQAPQRLRDGVPRDTLVPELLVLGLKVLMLQPRNPKRFHSSVLWQWQLYSFPEVPDMTDRVTLMTSCPPQRFLSWWCRDSCSQRSSSKEQDKTDKGAPGYPAVASARAFVEAAPTPELISQPHWSQSFLLRLLWSKRNLSQLHYRILSCPHCFLLLV